MKEGNLKEKTHLTSLPHQGQMMRAANKENAPSLSERKSSEVLADLVRPACHISSRYDYEVAIKASLETLPTNGGN